MLDGALTTCDATGYRGTIPDDDAGPALVHGVIETRDRLLLYIHTEPQVHNNMLSQSDRLIIDTLFIKAFAQALFPAR